MSRYTFRGTDPRYQLVVGWDGPLKTFFAQVEDLAWATHGETIDEAASIGDTRSEGLVLWVGSTQPILSLEAISRALALYGTLSEELSRQLEQDRGGEVGTSDHGN